MTSDDTPIIFDRKRQQAKQNRAYMMGAQDRFLFDYMAKDIADRLADVTRDFANILLIGPAMAYKDMLVTNKQASITHATFSPYEAEEKECLLIENDILPCETDSFDLIICFGILDGINALPQLLFQMRHALKPDGLFMGSLFGAGSLPTLKSAMLKAGEDNVALHINPQIDLHNMSELIVRAGFTLPVIDQDQLIVRYSKLQSLLFDIRAMGLGSNLSSASIYLGKRQRDLIHQHWTDMQQDDGKTAETFNILHMNGWAPSPDQPKPAKRGSGSMSLAQALNDKKDIS